jgi:homoserine O-acetyltransferase/O-succinyltransferase
VPSRRTRYYLGGDYLLAAHEDPTTPGPHKGLALARRLAHWSYRSREELGLRFGREPQTGEDPMAGGRYAVQSYLDHHGAKLTAASTRPATWCSPAR